MDPIQRIQVSRRSILWKTSTTPDSMKTRDQVLDCEDLGSYEYLIGKTQDPKIREYLTNRSQDQELRSLREPGITLLRETSALLEPEEIAVFFFVLHIYPISDTVSFYIFFLISNIKQFPNLHLLFTRLMKNYGYGKKPGKKLFRLRFRERIAKKLLKKEFCHSLEHLLIAYSIAIALKE